MCPRGLKKIQQNTRDRLNNKIALFKQFGSVSNVETITNTEPCIKAKSIEIQKNKETSENDAL